MIVARRPARANGACSSERRGRCRRTDGEGNGGPERVRLVEGTKEERFAMRRIIPVLATMMMLLGAACGAWAQFDDEDEAPPAPKKAKKMKKARAPAKKASLQKIELEGTIAKEGSLYFLTDADGTKVRLPAPRAAKGRKGKPAAASIKLDDYVGAKVKLTGEGTAKEQGGKKTISVKKITNIEKLAEDDAAVPDDAGGGDMF
jgi:hypothetical protein